MTITHCVTLYKISGSDPQKETCLTQFFCSKQKTHSISNAINKAVNKIRGELLDNYNDSQRTEETAEIKKYYDKCLEVIEKCKDIETINKMTEEQNTEQLIPKGYRISSFYDSKIKETIVYRKFEEPSTALLVVIDLLSSYDFHYYIEIFEIIDDEMEIIVHEH